MTYYTEIFDNWNEAVRWQSLKLQYCIDCGWGIRAASIDADTDFDTKKQMFRVLVRPFVLVEAQDGPTT